MTSTLHAVVSDECLTTSLGGRVKLSRPVRHISELELLGQRTGITHFWILPNSAAAGLGHEFVADRDGYNIFQTRNANGNPFTTPHFARCRKVGNGHEILAGYPDKVFGWVANEAADVLTAIEYLTTLLGVRVQWSPTHMGHSLLKQILLNRQEWLRESDVPLDTLPFNKAAKDVKFSRPLTPDMVGMTVHEFDGNSKYLAACEGVTVGSGTPVHRKPAVPVIATAETTGHTPGVYRVQVVSTTWDTKQLPPIIKGEWVTNDILQYALKNGYEVLLHEAYQFEEGHQLFRKWAGTLWSVRAELNPKQLNLSESPDKFPHRQGRANAYRTIKDIATQSVGAFAMKGVKHNLARNNWWADIVGKSRVTMLYHMKKFADAGYYPLFANCDAIGYATHESNPYEAVPGIMKRSNQLGGFKHAWSLLLTEEIVQQGMMVPTERLHSFLKEKAGVKDA